MAQNDSSKRAASMLTIAQHKLKQALKKEDNDARLPALAVELSAQFIADLDAVLKQNTPANVQKCAAWIVKHIAPSKSRTASLGDYMISVSKTIIVDQIAAAAVTTATRSRFALLLIISDVLHTDQYHQRSTAKSRVFGKDSMVFIPELVELAAASMSEKESQAEKKLRALINFWAVNQLVTTEDFRVLRDRTDEALMVAQGMKPIRRRNYLLPEYHGDRNAPWYDLPAAYMLDHMIRHPNKPIDPRHIQVAKLDKKAVSPHVRKLLDDYFENIDLKYVPTGDNPTGETKKHKLWLDPMGQLVKQDKETGETKTVYNGYGWSLKLCQDMQKDGVPETIRKAREEAQREEGMEMRRTAPQQRKYDRRVSPSPRRQRSSSSDSEYGRDRGRRSRSHSRHSSRSSYDGRRDSRSKGRHRSRSHQRESLSRRQHRDSDDGGRRYDDREQDQARPPPRAYGRDAPSSGQQWKGPQNRTSPINPGNSQYPMPPQSFNPGFSQPTQPPFSAAPYAPPPPMPHQFPGQFAMQPFPPPPPPPFQPGAFPGGVPPPPPPPPNFSGPYPPPPSNMTAMPSNAYNFGGNQFGSNMHGNNFGQGQRQGYGQGQGNFQGGRGGYRGSFQGGGNNGGGYGGQQRGQRGGRW